MRRFAEQPLPEFDTFRQACRYQSLQADRYLAKNDISLGRRSQIDKAEFTSIVNLSDETVKQRIREAQSEIDDAFVDAWTEFTVRRRVLITVDTFQLVADDEMGHWMIRLAKRLPNTLVVLARIPLEYAPWGESAGLHRIFLPSFTLEEIADYLGQRFRSRLRPGIAEIVHSFTDGHPGGVALIADLIMEKGETHLSSRDLRRILDRLPADPNQRWAELVRLILDAIQNPRLRRAVDAIALMATFDAPLLGQLIGTDATQDSDVSEVISELQVLRLLQQLRDLSGKPSDKFRLHEFIRLSVAAKLRTVDPQRWLEVHRVAAQHYFRLLRRWEEDPYNSYGAWYRFEYADWQEYKRDWLQHAGMSLDQPAMTRTRFTLVFLEVFWWWGLYAPFPFNRRLLEEWSRTSTAWERRRVTTPMRIQAEKTEDGQLLDALTYLLNNYPVSHLKPAGAPWDELRQQLLLIRRLCGLHRPAIETATPEERLERSRTDALITILLAHTRRFANPADSKAEQYYENAIATLQSLGDRWTVAWLYFERADLALERRDLKQAVDLVTESTVRARDLALATNEWDHELLANMYRLRADVDWLANETDRAAVGYGRAIINAYRFQGDPHAPDEYTQQFYIEIITRAAQRIAALIDRPTHQRSFVTTMMRELRGLATLALSSGSDIGGDVNAIREQLFPRGPADHELYSEDSNFMANWSVFNEEQVDPITLLAYIIGATRGL
ncbi:MAG: hypothetical protein M3460_23450 [Actinomycetota bacterium]|nr:hypothetical protein [Actinomycetota bacterium]